jgi:hypothetical protein
MGECCSDNTIAITCNPDFIILQMPGKEFCNNTFVGFLKPGLIKNYSIQMIFIKPSITQ